MNLDVIGGTEHLPLGGVSCKAIEGRQGIRRNGRAFPLDDVAIVVVMRWLHEDETKAAPHRATVHYLSPFAQMLVLPRWKCIRDECRDGRRLSAADEEIIRTRA